MIFGILRKFNKLAERKTMNHERVVRKEQPNKSAIAAHLGNGT
jgi:hypothetical protein